MPDDPLIPKPLFDASKEVSKGVARIIEQKKAGATTEEQLKYAADLQAALDRFDRALEALRGNVDTPKGLNDGQPTDQEPTV